MKINVWNSIVGKLWGTILLLVSFVLFVFTVLMLEFLNNYHTQQAEKNLKQEAAVVARIMDDHHYSVKETKSILSDIISDETNALVAEKQGDVVISLQSGENRQAIRDEITQSEKLNKAFTSKTPVIKEMMLPSSTEKNKKESYIVMAYPIETTSAEHGVIYIYQSPDAIHRTTEQTTKIVFLAAAIALVLTTLFTFFLSSRITRPLRKMREAAFDLAKGKFDTKVPVFQNDEIGQLGTAFNQMGRQLKHHVEVINQEKEQLSSILTSMTDAVITFNKDRTVLLSNPPAELLLQDWFLNKGSDSEKPLPIEIYHMLDHVLELEKLRSDFIANVSHELRTPISMLQGYAEAIVDDIVQDEQEQTEIIRIIYDESQRMGRLVNDLLDLARMESGNITLYEDVFPINPTFERITQKFVQRGREKNIDVSFESTFTNEATLLVDQDRIEQVLTNLIDNAIRHTPNGGHVKVLVDQQVNFARIRVQDDGAGIPKEDLPYVFERFYKADKARTRGKAGTGLGLAIARNIVEAHKGRILVESTVDVGTTFIFYLPLEQI